MTNSLPQDAPVAATSSPGVPAGNTGALTPSSLPDGISPLPPTVHAQPGDEEMVYFDGSPSAASVSGRIIGYFAISLVLLAIPILYHRYSDNHDWPIWWLNLSLFLIAILLPMAPLAKLKTIRYRITNYRIDYERGISSRDIDTLELWHVEDIHLHQSLWGRMLDYGAIEVDSRDEKLPKLHLIGLPKARGLFETLKQRVIAVKRQRGVVKMDPG